MQRLQRNSKVTKPQIHEESEGCLCFWRLLGSGNDIQPCEPLSFEHLEGGLMGVVEDGQIVDAWGCFSDL